VNSCPFCSPALPLTVFGRDTHRQHYLRLVDTVSKRGPQPGAQLDEATVKSFALENGPAFAHTRFVALRSEIPLAATNKRARPGFVRSF
jgi:hypothetical protein